ncbi:metastasis-associated protein MTA3 isoform X2 [Cimex lectularius]|uniref:Metastasis-associated protein MTA3 n=1 Tax=Cimex lectularius TaxID=79782 RepID=A0A8I6S7X2_CIMLE|nr:metastasis-associated protein MTA3 isoform X2 [Cimex lectularius]
MTANMYRVGDYVYFETTNITPYHIRRIEELNKTPNGNVEAKVMCFFRRRDLPTSILAVSDKKEKTEGEHWELRQELSTKQKHQLKQRELFLSRQVETLPATHIRGKCNVTLLNETESLFSYLNKEDTFFYCLVFDPNQRNLTNDKGDIHVGPEYQAVPPPLLKKGEVDPRSFETIETLLWTPEHNLTDKQIDQFLVTSRSVGTFARALDCSSSVKQPSLHMSAAAASRDITLFHAMDTLHKHGYILSDAVSSLVPSTGPVLCRDEMEEWSASEANIFEEALEKYGKDFNDIRQDFLPWKSLKNIIEYYYMWKTTDRYVQQKRVKAVEAESKLKQVYIPNYSKPNSALNNNKGGLVNGTTEMISSKPCESCTATTSNQWYAWGPSHMKCRLCHYCWGYWKRYGGIQIPNSLCGVSGGEDIDLKKKLGNMSDEERTPTMLTSHRPHRCTILGCAKEFKVKSQLARHYATIHGLAVRTGSPRPIMKTRTAFYLATTPLTKLSRRLCRNLVLSRHAARSPFWSINIQAIKQECQIQMAGKSAAELRALLHYRRKERGSVTGIATRLGIARNHELVVPEWLAPTDPDKLPKSERIAFPKPPKAPDGSLLYERIPNKPELEKPLNNTPCSGTKRKHCEEVNGIDDMEWNESIGVLSVHESVPSKRMSRDIVGGGPIGPRTIINHLNGKARVTTMSRTGRKQVISWMDAPDDVYFRSTELTKKVRRQLTGIQLRRAARKPWRKLSAKGMEDMVVVLE